jgi:diguanylate cyclase (GGDEF)-like protein
MTRNETGGAEGQAVDDFEQAASARDRSRDAAVPAGTTPGARQRLGAARLRDEFATRRDRAAEQRDELADQHDREADLADRRALEDEHEHDTGIPDERARRTRELYERGLEARDRAARDRERAKHDRVLARADRIIGESDRADAAREGQNAETDELTGASRRGAGLQELRREIDRARRTGRTLVAAYVDVDGLKAVNDEHGHQAGDELLQDVVEGLRRDMRSYDLLVRLGGDEFLCVLSGIDTAEARRRFEHLDTELPAGPTTRSVTIGLAELRDGDGPAELIDRADQNLIARRARGRRLLSGAGA